MNGTISRSEILSLVVRLTLFSAATYFSVKWMLNHLDPTNKQKKTAKIKVIQENHLYNSLDNKSVRFHNSKRNMVFYGFCIL